MAGGSWKVAYADFMTAMMAFFLLMWLLNAAKKETLEGVAGYFKEGAQYTTSGVPMPGANNPLIQYVDKLDTRAPLNETEQAHLAIAQSLKAFLLKDALPSASSGISSDNIGVLLHITSDLMFVPGTVKFTPEAERVLQEVVAVMGKYKVYLVVRGHADASETGAPDYPSKWDLSAARANAAVRWLVDHGVPPRMLRSVAYADSRPQVPSTIKDAAARNSRVEFFFHRQEVMSTVVGY